MSQSSNNNLVKMHDHDRSLAHDMEVFQNLNRRRALGFLGLAGGGLALAGCGSDGAGSVTSTTTATTTATPTPTPTPTPTSTGTASSSSCVSYASETNGPYPADGTNQSNGSTSNVLTNSNFVRSDIRSSLGTTAVAEGIELTFTISLADVNNGCAGLAGYVVYIWHCDANGDYSLYDLPSQDFLRGVQEADANGQVTFTTIIPGCYNGRYPHIHFEVFSSQANAQTGNFAVLVSQFSVPKDQLASIYASSSIYSGSVNALNNTSLSSDNVFGDNSSDQQDAMMVDLVDNGDGTFSASATVGIAT